MDFLQKRNFFKIHDCNLQKLLIETFKVEIKFAPEIIKEVFDIIACPYPLRNELRFKSRSIRHVWYGIETATFVGSRIWNCMTSERRVHH